MSSADRINIDPLINVQKVSGTNPFAERNASKRKQDNKKKSEQQEQDEKLEEDIGDGEFHVIDYKA